MNIDQKWRVYINMLIGMIQYNAEEAGIKVIVVEEDHTSKCSFLDNETIEHHEEYMGKRVSRGLFISASGTLIHADVNAAYKITVGFKTKGRSYVLPFENSK